jgi:NAD(P)-dependent dehydrogenase (short-subunit alcohol dehydrogenase family)
VGKQRWTSEQMRDQSGRVAIVTGANSGIGYEAALALAGKGATVILACRNIQQAETAVATINGGQPPGSAETMQLDLADLASVRAFAETFAVRYQRLDLLINNAGVMMPPASKTADGFELQFGTNHLGHFVLTALLLDLLRRTPGARVVNVSSIAHRYGVIDLDDPNWEERPYKESAAYGQSKLANLLFTSELQRRCEAAGIGVVAISCHPGWTRTNLQRHSGLFSFLNPFLAMKPWQGALPTLYAATADEVHGGAYYGPDGMMQMRGYPKAVASTEAARDADMARKLWVLSENLTGVRYDILDAADAAGG